MGSVVAVQRRDKDVLRPPAELVQEDTRSDLPMSSARAYQQRYKQPVVTRSVRARSNADGRAVLSKKDGNTSNTDGRDVSERGRDVSQRGRLAYVMEEGGISLPTTMKEARSLQQRDVNAGSARDFLDGLKAGNARFRTGTDQLPNLSLSQRRELIDGRAPKVMVIGCADSRVPIEIVFDQGLGVFVSHSDIGAGTVDFALNHLGIKLVVVMGHQGCGADRAALSRVPTELGEPLKLNKVLLDLDYCAETLNNDATAHDREAAIANPLAQVKKMVAEQNIAEKVAAGDVLVVAAFYEITSGIVDFIELPSLSATHL